MNAIRQFIDVKNNSFVVSLPDEFNDQRVEVIILPASQNDFNISNETKQMLDNRLSDYLGNPNDVQDFDTLLDELEREL
ncbi:hypothetical protein [Flavobacterium marginilacus]|uniref:hypothetical protein n=1 Tax=Flavobacterium marginilacus TaxID=3003256 RepID=UPI00248DED48|nr:hypothetical protein [Flavobacterium marginilacus]